MGCSFHITLLSRNKYNWATYLLVKVISMTAQMIYDLYTCRSVIKYSIIITS